MGEKKTKSDFNGDFAQWVKKKTRVKTWVTSPRVKINGGLFFQW